STGDINPLTVKNVAAMLTCAVEDRVIVPFESAVLTGAEKTSVLIPLVPVPTVLSPLFVYVFPALSLTVMVDAVASTAIVAKIMLAAATVIPVFVKPVTVLLPLAYVAMFVGVMPPVLNETALPVKAFPALSVAVARTVYVVRVSDDHTGRATLSVQVVAVPDVVALFVVARFAAAACQVAPFQ